MSPKTGRPPKENPKNIKINLRFTQETADVLQDCAEKMNESRAAVVEKGIYLVKAELEKKE